MDPMQSIEVEVEGGKCESALRYVLEFVHVPTIREYFVVESPMKVLVGCRLTSSEQ